jgi:hypothetical protein
VQPPYIAIDPAPGKSLPLQRRRKVSIRKTITVGDAIDAEKARQFEGESLAR